MQPTLIYFADPMCSWCWGFSPVIERVLERFSGRLDATLLMGGLYAGNPDPLDENTRNTIREHWTHVHEASGQPFDFGFFERQSFVYNTEPPCRAVVTAREMNPGSEFAYLRLTHRAFYADNRDVTDAAVLADIATEVGFEREGFLRAFADPETRLATGDDFATTRTAGISAFPALVAGNEAIGLEALTIGYQPFEAIEALVDAWMERHGLAAA